MDEADAVPWSSKIPKTSDFLFSWGTFPGFPAFRRISGSYYIQTLCHILDAYGTEYDLMNNLTLVASVVAEEFEMGNGKKQMPTFDSTLTKLIFFRPKKGVFHNKSSPITLNQQPSQPKSCLQNLQPQPKVSPTSTTLQNCQFLQPQFTASNDTTTFPVQQSLYFQLISPPSSNLQNLRPPTSLPSSLEAVLQSSVQTQNTSLESLNYEASD